MLCNLSLTANVGSGLGKDHNAMPGQDQSDDGETWGWTKDPPESKRTGGGGGEKSSRRKHLSIQQKLLKEFGCSLCRKVMQLPLSTPCGHNFCKPCLVDVFSGQQDMRERIGVRGHSLRIQKVVKRCPTCKGEITDFMSCPQVNRQMESLIQNLKSSIADGDDEEALKAETNIAERDSKDQDEVREEVVKDTDDESDNPAVPPGNGHSKATEIVHCKLAENGHSKSTENGHSKPAANGHSKPTDNGHSDSLASKNLSSLPSMGIVIALSIVEGIGGDQAFDQLFNSSRSCPPNALWS